MPDARSFRHPITRISRGNAGQHPLEVERQRGHPELTALRLPFVAGPVAIDLDPVALRVVEVERLGDEMIGRTREPPAGGGDPVHGTRELGP